MLKTFQVKTNAQRNFIIPGKPGGRTVPLSSTYFLLQQVKDGYQLLNATHTPDPHCTGPDLIQKSRR